MNYGGIQLPRILNHLRKVHRRESANQIKGSENETFQSQEREL